METTFDDAARRHDGVFNSTGDGGWRVWSRAAPGTGWAEVRASSAEQVRFHTEAAEMLVSRGHTPAETRRGARGGVVVGSRIM